MAVTLPDGLFDAFEAAERSIFRLETLQYYAGDPNFDRFLAGEPWRDSESKAHWCDLVRRRTSDGVSMQRVHVVTEPLSDYLRFELTWSYPPNVAAGEDIRVLSTPSGQWPQELPEDCDFWLFDEAELWVMRYHPDGTLLGADIVVSSTLVDAACRWREYAIAVSTSWVDYVSARPDLKSLLRGVALTAF